VPNLEDVKEGTGVETRLLVDCSQQGGLGALLRQQSGREVELQTLGNLVLELNLGPEHVRGRPSLGESEPVVLDVVLGLEVPDDSGLGIPDEGNLEGHARGGGGLDVESGTVDGEILAQEVIGGFSEVLQAENASEMGEGKPGNAVPSRRVGLVEGEPFGSSGEEEGLWEVASSRSILTLAFMPALSKETRTIHAEIRTGKDGQVHVPPRAQGSHQEPNQRLPRHRRPRRRLPRRQH